MTTRTLSLTKDGQKHVFKYSPGCESDVVTHIMQLAGDKRSGLDWLDAATLSFQVAQAAASDCSNALRPFQDVSGLTAD